MDLALTKQANDFNSNEYLMSICIFRKKGVMSNSSGILKWNAMLHWMIAGNPITDHLIGSRERNVVGGRRSLIAACITLIGSMPKKPLLKVLGGRLRNRNTVSDMQIVSDDKNSCLF